MAKAKTAPFWIAEAQVGISTSVESQTIDIGAYVDPADSQGLEILSVDYIWDETTNLPPSFTDQRATAQLKDNTNGDLVSPTNLHLISSGHLSVDAGSYLSTSSDVFPDRLNLGKDGGRVVVNDSLEFCVKGSATANNLRCTVRICARVITLTKKDYMTLALQTVADNN